MGKGYGGYLRCNPDHIFHEMIKPFQIIIGSPPDYTELVAYVRIHGEQVALVSQDNGKDDLEVVFFYEPMLRKAKFDILISALHEAKEQLLR